jgi:hypothetical protein
MYERMLLSACMVICLHLTYRFLCVCVRARTRACALFSWSQIDLLVINIEDSKLFRLYYVLSWLFVALRPTLYNYLFSLSSNIRDLSLF